jgi:ABC-type transport system involved in cytochrome bd biosynthesis fused ATPase/permease subunit
LLLLLLVLLLNLLSYKAKAKKKAFTKYVKQQPYKHFTDHIAAAAAVTQLQVQGQEEGLHQVREEVHGRQEGD